MLCAFLLGATVPSSHPALQPSHGQGLIGCFAALAPGQRGSAARAPAQRMPLHTLWNQGPLGDPSGHAAGCRCGVTRGAPCPPARSGARVQAASKVAQDPLCVLGPSLQGWRWVVQSLRKRFGCGQGAPLGSGSLPRRATRAPRARVHVPGVCSAPPLESATTPRTSLLVKQARGQLNTSTCEVRAGMFSLHVRATHEAREGLAQHLLEPCTVQGQTYHHRKRVKQRAEGTSSGALLHRVLGCAFAWGEKRPGGLHGVLLQRKGALSPARATGCWLEGPFQECLPPFPSTHSPRAGHPAAPPPPSPRRSPS